ncbi:MAG: uridine monophosphate kinase [Puniceicoccales bacterium]|nr:uridine monophosphate kinase [Puniceicoccales bacterium]
MFQGEPVVDIPKRILLKLSGESLGSKGEPFDGDRIHRLTMELGTLQDQGIEIGMVVGGGNIFRGNRGAFAARLDRPRADDVGMLATGLNALVLQSYLSSNGIPASAYGAFAIPGKLEEFCLEKVRNDLAQKKTVIFYGGTGLPYFSTDSAAAVRAAEIGADLLMKGTHVNGVYDKDPGQYPNAKRYDRLTYHEAFSLHLQVMDATAFALCRETGIPTFVFKIFGESSLWDIVRDQKPGTWVSN